MTSEIISQLEKMVMDFDIDNAEEIAIKAIDSGVDPLNAASALTNAIRKIGDMFGAGELFLPDLVCASEVLKKSFPIIEAEIKKRGKEKKSLAKVVIGTVYGDIHSIGKGMVSTLLYAEGFEVIDLGVNVESSKFLEAIKMEKPNILAMSALLTTTANEQKKVIEGLVVEDIRDKVKIIVGGAPVNQEFADSIGADGYGANAPEAVKIVKHLLKIN
jgi:corrinoid protein of di/trimethylamine methyltransferase